MNQNQSPEPYIRKKRRRRLRPGILTGLLILAALLLTFALFKSCHGAKDTGGSSSTDPGAAQATSILVQTESTPPAEPKSATIVSTGDLLIHDPILTGAYRADTGSYSFDEIFGQIGPYLQRADYAVANLEVPLGGTEAGKYRGYPTFNCPDSIAEAAKGAGFDMLLTANNHAYDTGAGGMRRTQEVLKSLGLDYTGTRLAEGDKNYLVREIGGITFGLVNYTYETPRQNGRKTLNGILLSEQAAPLINSFDYNALDDFYGRIGEDISSMENEGAEAVVVYIHWGDEYKLSPNEYQKKIAQKLCDSGVDLIVGGHPHVVEPVETLRSDISGKQTLCVYSLGNAVSNQRRERMNLKTGHTEDGLLFYTTFTKSPDGKVALTRAEAVPVWVRMTQQAAGKQYTMMPLPREQEAGAFGSSADKATLGRMKESFDRTGGLIFTGIDAFNESAGSLPTQ